MEDSTSYASNNRQKSQIEYSPTSTPAPTRFLGMPPGFSGDALRASSVSAPPPGFHGSQAEQKQQRENAATSLLYRHPWEANNNKNINDEYFLGVQTSPGNDLFSNTISDSLQGLQLGTSERPSFIFSQPINPTYPGSVNEHESSSRIGPGSSGNRTTSFNNLSKVLGESMAQSIDDSVNTNNIENKETVGFGSASFLSSTSNPQTTLDRQPPDLAGIDNVQRQSRHMSSRLIGPRVSSSDGAGLPDYFEQDFGASNGDNNRLFSNTLGNRNRMTMTIQEPNEVSSPSLEYANFGFGKPTSRETERLRSVREGYGDSDVGNGPGSSIMTSTFHETDHSSSPSIRGLGGLSAMDRLRIGGALSFRSGSAPPEMDFFASSDYRSPIHALPSTATVSTRQRAFGSTSLTSSPSNIPEVTSSTPYPRPGAPPPPSHSTPPKQRERKEAAAQDELMRMTEKELAPYLRETMQTSSQYMSNANVPSQQPTAHPSRGLCILASGLPLLQKESDNLNPAAVRSVCESFGALDSFRIDFWNTRRVIFLSFFDLRSAQKAATGLARALYRLVESTFPHHVSATAQFIVKYCLPLQASSPTDEATILVSNLPPHVDEHALASFMESYGGVRSVHFVVLGNSASLDEEDNAAYMVEFYDVQDAKQALLELESSEPWGPMVRVEVGMRNPSKRRQAKDLLRLIGRWRMESSGSNNVPDRNGRRSSLGESNFPSNSSRDQGKASRGFMQIGSGSTDLYSQETTNNHYRTPSGGFKSSTLDLIDPRSNVKGPSPGSVSSSPLAKDTGDSHSPMPEGDSDRGSASSVNNTHGGRNPSDSMQHQPHQYYVQSAGAQGADSRAQMGPHQAPAQLVMGPDGQYSYVLHPAHFAGAAGNTSSGYYDPQQQLIPAFAGYGGYRAPHQSVHHPHAAHHMPGPGQIVMPSYIDARTGYPIAAPVYLAAPHPQHQHEGSSSGRVSHNRGAATGKRQGVSGYHGKQLGNEPDSELALDIAVVKSGGDTRTSLMVRNIPNKYTQKMLLEEFAQYGHGSDKMDFFYLPIDFKNKCNRGYAFVNFVDFQDIVPFYNQYNGQSWKVFNSDKICDITYARIQGKAAMLKRFEHSALLDKEDEYRPLVFVSHGPKKGQREEFTSGQQGYQLQPGATPFEHSSVSSGRSQGEVNT